MPAKKTAAQTIAADIVTRAKKAVGPMWSRMSPDGHLVEVRSIMCCDMLRTLTPPDHALMLEVHSALVAALLPD